MFCLVGGGFLVRLGYDLNEFFSHRLPLVVPLPSPMLVYQAITTIQDSETKDDSTKSRRRHSLLSILHILSLLSS
jgi:hypothetical protein